MTYIPNKKLDERLEESALRLMSAEDVKFSDMKPEGLQAIAFKGRHRDNIDPHYGWDWFKIFNNPMRLSEETYTPINSDRDACFKQTRILTLNLVEMKMWGFEDHLGIIAWMKGKRSRHKEFGFDIIDNPDGEVKTVSGETRVIPIYACNPDFHAVMDYIESNR